MTKLQFRMVSFKTFSCYPAEKKCISAAIFVLVSTANVNKLGCSNKQFYSTIKLSENSRGVDNMIYEFDKPNYKYLAVNWDYVKEGVTLFEFGKVYEILDDKVIGEDGVAYPVEDVKVATTLFKEYPKNKFVIRFDNPEALEEIKRYCWDTYTSLVSRGIVYVEAERNVMRELSTIEGVQNVRYQSVITIT